MTKTIVIHTPLELATFDYYKYMHLSATSNASGTHFIKFKAYIMGSIDNIDNQVKSYFESNSIDLVPTGINDISSLGHAKALSIIFENFSNSNINIISDSDVVICHKDFDHVIVSLLATKDVIGTKYENIGGPCVEENYPKVGTRFQTYKNRPNLIWCAFTDRHLFNDIRVSAPNTRDTCKQILTEEDEIIWGLPKNYMLWKDAGWEFPKYLFDRNLKFLTFIKCNPYEQKSPEGTIPKVLNGDFKKDLSYQDAIYSEEYQLKDGTPFLIHQRGSRKRKFRIDTVSKRFYNAYERFVKNQNG